MYYHADLVINYDGVRQFIFNFFFYLTPSWMGLNQIEF